MKRNKLCCISSICAAALIMWPHQAAAESCSYSIGQALPIQSAAVSHPGRTSFVQGSAKCQESDKGCRSLDYVNPGSYLTRGDKVVVIKEVGLFSCVSYQKTGGSREWLGWIPTSALFTSRAERNNLIGSWRGPAGAVAAFRKADGAIIGSAEAVWPGGAKGSAVLGVASFRGPVTREGSYWLYRDSTCEVHFAVAGQIMIAADNGSCGGSNATLSGRYQLSEH